MSRLAPATCWSTVGGSPLRLDLSGGYRGNGRATSLGDFALNAASLDLGNAASLAGGANVTLGAGNLLVNRGRITAPWLEAWARLSLPLASMRMSPPLAAMSPASFTPTPCSVPTRRIAPAYIPPSAELSIAS